MDEGVFVEWLKNDGDQINEGDPLFTLEGEKAVQDIESIDQGILRIPTEGPREGDTVAVGMVLGYLVDADEPAPFELETNKATQSAELNEETSEFDLSSVAVNAPQRTRLAERGVPKISPRAARAATQLGVDWTALAGTGRNGRIREEDVRSAATSLKAQSPRDATESSRIEPLTSVRKIIADRMLASRQHTAPVTLTTTADATNLVALRTQFESVPDAVDAAVPSYNDIIVKLTANALSQHPQFNVRSNGYEVQVFEQINIGIAVNTELGLLVPVIRDVGSLSLQQVATESCRLIERASNRQLSADELQGGTFTVTNLGAFGVDAFTPIINYPECAILGIGRITKQPTVVDDQIVARDMVTLSLTFDHRLVDGASAAKFLQAIRDRIENPSPWLMP